jgi:uncharacterized protein YbjT (DUF2867 family)
MKVFVTAATGTVGSHLVKMLAEKGVQVRAGAHNPEKAKKLAHKNVEVAQFDVTDAASVEQAVKGIDKIYFISPPIVQNRVELAQRLIDSAKKAGIKHIVRMSAMGADAEPGIQLGKWLMGVEKHLSTSGIDWTILRPTFFMQNFLTFPATQGNYYQPLGDGKLGYIDVRDIAEAAMKALTEQGHSKKTYNLTGPELLTSAEAVAKISSSTGREFKYVDVPAEAARSAMVNHGMPEWYADALGELYAGAKAGYAAVLTGDAEKILGRKPTAFDKFASDHANAF